MIDVVVLAHERDGRQLAVVWRFRNDTSRPYYLLIKGWLSITAGDPIVINHTATGHAPFVDPNVDPDMAFATVPPHAQFDLTFTYTLPRPGHVVAKFAGSESPPDRSWPRAHAWDAVAKWQEVIQSPRFEI